MHAEARSFIADRATSGTVVEFGSRNINGAIRDLFPGPYIGVDIEPGPGVDVVGDAASFTPDQLVDVVVCCEVLEHAPNVGEIVENAWRILKPGGLLLLTAACPPRAPHSAVDGGPIRPGEHYRNIDPAGLAECLRRFTTSHVETHPRGDIYAEARK